MPNYNWEILYGIYDMCKKIASDIKMKIEKPHSRFSLSSEVIFLLLFLAVVVAFSRTFCALKKGEFCNP